MKSKSFAVENGWICQILNNSIIPVFGDLEIVDGILSKIRIKDFENFTKNPGKIREDSINANGRVITVPKVNFHDHIYSRLATGLPVHEPQNNFYEILHNFWWKIDRALDLAMIRASAELAALESIKNGVMYVFDHHASPYAIEGSLSEISNVFFEFGIRGVLCFEISDRNGVEISKKSLEESLNFIEESSNSEIKSMLGMHASFTVSDDTLNDASRIIKEYNLGLHIHACEDEIDRSLSYEFAQQFPVDRLVDNKLLNVSSIIAHGIYLNESDLAKIVEAGSALAFNLESNMNNAVGLPDIVNIPEDIPVIFGTDGMHADPFRSMKLYYLLLRHNKTPHEKAFHLVRKSYMDQIAFVQRYFPDFPTLNENQSADFIVWDYSPATPLTESNFWSHFIFKIVESRIISVAKKGKFLMKDFTLTDVDEIPILINIRHQGEKLYNKFQSRHSPVT